MLTGLAIAATTAVLWYLGIVFTIYLYARFDRTNDWSYADHRDWFLYDVTILYYMMFWPVFLVFLAIEGLIYLSFLAAKKGAEDWKAKNSTSSQSDSAK